MRKIILLIVIIIAAGLLVYRLLSDKKTLQPPPPDQALKISRNPTGFDSAFAALMNDYFSIRNALVDWDTVKADQATARMGNKADSLPVQLLKADNSIVLTAKSLAASIGGEAKGLVGETGIVGRRHSFDMVTRDLFDLVRTVRYGGDKVYYIKCPMAFGDSTEGYWLNNSATVVNPYLGNKHPTYGAKMLGCGEITDSLDFGKR